MYRILLMEVEFVARRSFSKNAWVLVLLMLTGIVLGSFIGHITKDVAALSWLNYGLDFGIGSPDTNGIVSLNLGVLIISFGLKLRISIASVLGMVLSIFIYRKL